MAAGSSAAQDTKSPLRALLGAVVMTLALVIGAAVVLQTSGATFSDFAHHAFGASDRATFWGRATGALAVLFGLSAILFAYVAWYEEPRFDGVAHSGFPRFIPVVLWAATLALVVISVGALKKVEPAKPAAPEAPASPPATPKPEDPLPLEGGAPPEPKVTAIPLSATYTFKYPLITTQGAVGLNHTERDVAMALPIDDADGSVRALLCDKAWVALAGSASQEGDRQRNEIRSRLRTEAAVARAETWLAAHPDFAAPVLIGLDLGQHEPVVSDPRFDGVDTAGQRRLIVVSRALRAGETRPSLDAALDEAEAFYKSPVGRAAILGGRRFEREPVWLALPN
ncbi:MAG: hypothetical protein K2Q06_06845 [Parvularculaceae bacterium]|nr:hypothetical protein [Parvularculaceae bacterium]